MRDGSAVADREVAFEVAGYATRLSLSPGAPLDVHVASRRPAGACYADIYRITGMEGAEFWPSLEFVDRSAPLEALAFPSGPPGRRLGPGNADVEGCGWPLQRAFSAVPSTWPSGLYLAQFTYDDEPSMDASRELGRDALFVVRSAEPGATSSALVQLGVATWSAYHIWQNRNLYIGDVRDPSASTVSHLRAHKVSFHRPGIGLAPPSNTWLFPPKAFTYVLPFIQWATEEGLTFEYCTGLDIDDGSVDLNAYRLLLTIGHDEYWTRAQRERVERYCADGGNAAFFGGNLAYWQIRTVKDGSAIECYKRGPERYPGLGTRGEPLDPTYRDPAAYPEHDNSTVTVQFFSEPVNWSTVSLSGVSMRNDGDIADVDPRRPDLMFCGAAWWWENFGGPPRPAKGFTVSATHWAFEGTGLTVGDSFGEEQKVVGFECDGLDATWMDGRPIPSGREPTPPDLRILAYADCTEWAETDFANAGSVACPGRRMTDGALGGLVTLVHFTTPGGGEVFTAPVTDWTHALVSTVDYTEYRAKPPRVTTASEAVRRITRNVVERLSDRRAAH